jgi:hypothetical protein
LSLQILTNAFTIVGVLAATLQISSTRQIIQAIFTSQEKAASYRILAMKTEMQTNLVHIQDVLANANQYRNLHETFQIPLSTAVYFSNPTFFKLEHLDKDANLNINEKLSEVYASWQIANSLIQASQNLADSAALNPRVAQINLLKNNLKILELLEKTRQPAQEVLKALDGESGPA